MKIGILKAIKIARTLDIAEPDVHDSADEWMLDVVLKLSVRLVEAEKKIASINKRNEGDAF